MSEGIRRVVGIDAGTTVGICLLDFDGNFLEAYSKKHIASEGIMRFLCAKGRVTIVATDVNPAPDSVKKVATVFNSVLYLPERDLTVGEKNKTLRLFFEENPLVKLNNKHERDATASALAAYYFYRNKLNRIEQRLEKISFEGDVEYVKEKVLHGISVVRAINDLKG